MLVEFEVGSGVIGSGEFVGGGELVGGVVRVGSGVTVGGVVEIGVCEGEVVVFDDGGDVKVVSFKKLWCKFPPVTVVSVMRLIHMFPFWPGKTKR